MGGGGGVFGNVTRERKGEECVFKEEEMTGVGVGGGLRGCDEGEKGGGVSVCVFKEEEMTATAR